MECVLKYQKMNSNAFDLSKGSSLSAGFDLKRFLKNIKYFFPKF